MATMAGKITAFQASATTFQTDTTMFLPTTIKFQPTATIGSGALRANWDRLSSNCQRTNAGKTSCQRRKRKTSLS